MICIERANKHGAMICGADRKVCGFARFTRCMLGEIMRLVRRVAGKVK